MAGRACEPARFSHGRFEKSRVRKRCIFVTRRNRLNKPLPPCLSQTQRDNLWSKVSKGQPHECWPWLSSLSGSEYPKVWINDIGYVATRVAYLDFYGIQPGELLVCHSCDNTTCMNPNHFFLGTSPQNTADKVEKGRQCKGTDHHLCKLSEEQVIEIFRLRGIETSTSLARRFNISKSTVKAIWSGRNWSHLTGKVYQ